MPSDALSSATADPSRFGGSRSRNTLIPIGAIPTPMPCSPRPTIIGNTEDDSAHTTEPAISGTVDNSRIRRLPYRSPRRPATGVVTAATSSVDVTTHDAFDAVVCSNCGNCAMSGITTVCMIAATMPANASTPTIRPVLVVSDLSTPTSLVREASNVHYAIVM